jgi:hypothetical protein
VHVEGTVGLDSNPKREAGGEQGAFPFFGAILDAGLEHGGEETRLRAAITEGLRFHPTAPDADLVASRLDLDGAWSAGDHGEMGATLTLRDLSDRGDIRSETDVTLRLDTRVRLARFDAEAAGGFSALFPRTSVLEQWAAAGPDAGFDVGFEPTDRQRVRIGWELRARRFPKWPTERWDVANGLVLDWSRRGTVIAGAGYGLTANQSTVDGAGYFRHRFWFRAGAELPWEVTLAAQGSLQWSNYPAGQVGGGATHLLADETENALELRFSRPLGEDFEAVVKVAAYRAEFSSTGSPELQYRREVVQLSIGWRPER